MMFVVPGEHPDLARTTETLATITGGHVTVIETRPYVADKLGNSSVSAEGKRCAKLRLESRAFEHPVISKRIRFASQVR